MPNTIAGTGLIFPVFSDSLKKMLSEIPGPVTRELKKLTGLVNPEQWLSECRCRDCRAELETKNANIGLFNQTCGMNYFSYREKEGMVSYLPQGKELQVGARGEWLRKCRQETTPGRWAQKILTCSLLPKDIKEFNDLFLKKEMEERISIHIVSVSEAYHSEVRSCMSGSPVEGFYNLFGTEAVIAKQHGRVISRALLWREVEGQPHKAPLLDRIYPAEGAATEALKDYAKSQGWWRKRSQGAGQEDVIAPDGSGHSCRDWKVLNRHPERTKCDRMKKGGGVDMFFPYIDTFFNSDKDLTFIGFSPVAKGWIYVDQHGKRQRQGPGLIECQASRELFDPEVAVRIDNYRYAPWNVHICHFTGRHFTTGNGYVIIDRDGNIFNVSVSALTGL